MAKATSTNKQLRVELIRSLIGAKPEQKATAKALGLGRINSSVVIQATPSLVGMVRTLHHLVAVEEVK